MPIILQASVHYPVYETEHNLFRCHVHFMGPVLFSTSSDLDIRALSCSSSELIGLFNMCSTLLYLACKFLDLVHFCISLLIFLKSQKPFIDLFILCCSVLVDSCEYGNEPLSSAILGDLYLQTNCQFLNKDSSGLYCS